MVIGIFFNTDSDFGIYYTLAEYNGKLGIFTENQSTPIDIIDTDFDSLPETDKANLKNGITVFSAEELHSLIEDFSG